MPQPLTAVPSLGYKPSHYVFPVDGGASYIDTYGVGRSDIYDGWHHGDDLFAPLGTPIVAVARGTLSLVGWNELGGWRVWLTDKKGNSFYYAHLAGYARWILTHPHVRAGQVIGFLGRTGDAYTTEPHLHFEVHPHQPAFVKLGYDGAVNPTTYLQKWKVEHVPKDEMPQPARLKAPVGAPTQEASVVWHQLLVARHLLGLKNPSPHSTSAAVVHRAVRTPAAAPRGRGLRGAVALGRAADLRAHLRLEQHAPPGRRAARWSARALGRRRGSIHLPPSPPHGSRRRGRSRPDGLAARVGPVALALLVDGLVRRGSAARAAHRDAVFLDDALGPRVPILVALDAAARVARPVERVDISLLPRRRGLVVPLAEKPLPHAP